MAKLFEQSENTNPNTAQRVAFGRASAASENITLANLLVWLNTNLDIYTTSEIDALILPYTVVNIGDWDMDATKFVSIAHGIADITKIRSVSVMIRKDDGTLLPLCSFDSIASDGTVNGAVGAISGTNIILTRKDGGNFDSTDYDQTSYNRGFIVFNLTA